MWSFDDCETLKAAVHRYYGANATERPEVSIDQWDVSRVTDMSDLFRGCYTFNEDISLWDVSGVTNMRAMFCSTSFNQPVGGWDVSNVTDMAQMFFDTHAFNLPLDT